MDLKPPSTPTKTNAPASPFGTMPLTGVHPATKAFIEKAQQSPGYIARKAKGTNNFVAPSVVQDEVMHDVSADVAKSTMAETTPESPSTTSTPNSIGPSA